MPLLRLTVNDPGYEGEYVFRAPDVIDFEALRALGGALAAGRAVDPSTLTEEQIIARGAGTLRFVDGLIVRCLRPRESNRRIVSEEECLAGEAPEGAFSVRELRVQTRNEIGEALLQAGDYGKEAQQQIADFPEARS